MNQQWFKKGSFHHCIQLVLEFLYDETQNGTWKRYESFRYV